MLQERGHAANPARDPVASDVTAPCEVKYGVFAAAHVRRIPASPIQLVGHTRSIIDWTS